MLGNKLAVPQALDLIVRNKVVPLGDIKATAFQIGEGLKKNPPSALNSAKKALNLNYDAHVKTARWLEGTTHGSRRDSTRFG